MKRIIALLLVFTFLISLSACATETEPREISCDEIIAAYEAAGYAVEHFDRFSEEDALKCSVHVSSRENPEKNYLYINIHRSEDSARAAAEDTKYGIATWIVFATCGEWRWLKVGYYGVIEYSTYNDEMLKPLKGLMS
jgi:hypothetical protein